MRTTGWKTCASACFVTALAVTAGTARPGQMQSRPQAVFPATVELVTVDVVVLDKGGKTVEGLTQTDFVVRENGEPQAITTFEAVSVNSSAPAPLLGKRVSTNTVPDSVAARWFFVIFDDVNISQYSTPRARQAVVQFIERALRPGDHVMVAPTSGGAWWSGRLPENRAELMSFVERLEGARRPDTSPARIWDHEAMAIALGREPQALAQVARRYFENNLIPEAYPMDPQLRKDLDVSPGIALIQAKAREVYREAAARLRLSLVSLERVVTALAQERGRKTLLLVSEGFIMDSSQTEFRRLLQAARNANAAVHFVDVRSPGGMLGQPGMAGGAAEFGAAVEERDSTTTLGLATREADGAYSVALDTGGTIVAGTNLLDGLTRIAAEARSYYLLGYSPTNKKQDGRFRKIEVRVSRPDVVVRARGGYYADGDGAGRASRNGLEPAIRQALDAPWGTSGIPMRLASYVLGPQNSSTLQVLLVAEAELTPLHLEPSDGRYKAAFDSYLVMHRLEGGSTRTDERLIELEVPTELFDDIRRNGLPIRREFSLEPGRYQARLLLRDRATNLLGSLRHDFEVPDTAAFRASTPIVTDTTQAETHDQPGRLVPIARRTFEPGSRLFCAFEIYGASSGTELGEPRVSVEYRLRRPDNSTVVSGRARLLKTGPLGQVPVTIAFVIPADTAGPHELQLLLRDEVNARELELNEPLFIGPR